MVGGYHWQGISLSVTLPFSVCPCSVGTRRTKHSPKISITEIAGGLNLRFSRAWKNQQRLSSLHSMCLTLTFLRSRFSKSSGRTATWHRSNHKASRSSQMHQMLCESLSVSSTWHLKIILQLPPNQIPQGHQTNRKFRPQKYPKPLGSRWSLNQSTPSVNLHWTNESISIRPPAPRW